MADDKTMQCAHKDCTCHTQNGAKYCSESCRTSAEAGADSGCRCGHAGCAAADYVRHRVGNARQATTRGPN
jgi:hypothetical protein